MISLDWLFCLQFVEITRNKDKQHKQWANSLRDCYQSTSPDRRRRSGEERTQGGRRGKRVGRETVNESTLWKPTHAHNNTHYYKIWFIYNFSFSIWVTSQKSETDRYLNKLAIFRPLWPHKLLNRVLRTWKPEFEPCKTHTSSCSLLIYFNHRAKRNWRSVNIL